MLFYLMRWLQLHESTSTRLQFDRATTVRRPALRAYGVIEFKYNAIWRFRNSIVCLLLIFLGDSIAINFRNHHSMAENNVERHPQVVKQGLQQSSFYNIFDCVVS